jgi:hypothetical protein
MSYLAGADPYCQWSKYVDLQLVAKSAWRPDQWHRPLNNWCEEPLPAAESDT